MEVLPERVLEQQRQLRKVILRWGIAGMVVLALAVGAAWYWSDRYLSAQNDLHDTNEKILCIAQLQSEFMGEVGDFANSPPAPNPKRDEISAAMKATANTLHGVARSGNCR